MKKTNENEINNPILTEKWIEIEKIKLTQEQKREKQIKDYLKQYEWKQRNPNWLTILWWIYWQYGVLLDFDMLEFRKDWEILKYIFLNKKQREAFKKFQDDNDPTEEILYWGWAGWWKSFLLAVILFINSILLPWSWWFVWRRVLKDVRTSTISDTLSLMQECWFNDFNHNQQDSIIRFYNKSYIKYWELENLPSDPTFKRLWSFQYTGVFIDEAQETILWAKSALRFRLRLNRLSHTNEDWSSKIIWKKKGKMYYSCNPWKNWLFTDFFIPFEKWQLDLRKAFIQALPEDNEFLDDEVLDLYRNTDDKMMKQIYYYWNWHYDNDPSILFKFDDLTQMFLNDISKWKNNEYYMSVDISWKWKDKTVIIIWRWLRVIHIEVEDKTDQEVLIKKLEQYEKDYWIKRKNVVVDSSWLWAWFEDFYKWCKRFIWAAKSIEKLEEEIRKLNWDNKDHVKIKYLNDRAACFFKLAKYVEDWNIYFENKDYKEEIINELSFIKEEISVSDKLEKKIISKDNIKKLLWNSPDFADAISMRMIFDFNIEEKEDERTIDDFNIFF